MKLIDFAHLIIALGVGINALVIGIMIATRFPLLTGFAFWGVIGAILFTQYIGNMIGSKGIFNAITTVLWLVIGTVFRMLAGLFISEVFFSVVFLLMTANGNATYLFDWSNTVLFGFLLGIAWIVRELPESVTEYKVERTGIKKTTAWIFSQTISWSKVKEVLVEYYLESKEEDSIYTISVRLNLEGDKIATAGIYECNTTKDVFENPYALDEVENYQRKEFIEEMRFLEEVVGTAKWTCFFVDEDGKETKKIMPKPSKVKI